MKEIAMSANTWVSFVDTIDRVNNSLNEMCACVIALDNVISHLQIGVQSYNSSAFLTGSFHTPGMAIFRSGSIPCNANKDQNSKAVKEKSRTEEAKKIAEVSSAVGKIVDKGFKFSGELEKLPPVLSKMQRGIKGLTGVLDTVLGAEGVTSGVSLGEEIIAASTFLDGIEGLAAIAAFLGGPVGLAIGAGTLAVGGIAWTIHENNKLAHPETPPSFSQEAIKNGNKYLLDLENTNKNADAYIKIAETPSEKSQVEIDREVEKMRNGLLRKGGVLTFDWKLAEGKDPVYLKALSSVMFANDRRKDKPITRLVFDAEEDMKAFQRTFDKFKRFPLTVNKRVDKRDYFHFPHLPDGPATTIYYTTSESRKEYLKHTTPRVYGMNPMIKLIQDNILKGAVQTYLSDPTAGYKYLKAEYKDKMKLPGSTPAIRMPQIECGSDFWL